jgi:hypothetical protein
MDETAEKLDSMMDLTARHLLRREAAGELHLYFATLMRAFDSALLHVHRSKFTQFLLFHVRTLCSPPPRIVNRIPALRMRLPRASCMGYASRSLCVSLSLTLTLTLSTACGCV